MDQLVSIILLELPSSLGTEVKTKDVGSGCIGLNKFSANEAFTSWDDLVTDDFSVHHDGVIEIYARDGGMKDIRKDGICTCVFYLLQEDFIGHKWLDFDDSILCVDHRVAVIVEQDCLGNRKV